MDELNQSRSYRNWAGCRNSRRCACAAPGNCLLSWECSPIWNISASDAGEVTGRIPPELGNLSNLTHLSLFGNKLSGEIPPELGKLRNLAVLRLQEEPIVWRDPGGTGTTHQPGVTSAWRTIRCRVVCPATGLSVAGLLPACSVSSTRISQQQADQEYPGFGCAIRRLGRS